MYSPDGFWNITALVNHGMVKSGLLMEIKFETLLSGLLDPMSNETKYRLWMTSHDNPSMLYVSILSSKQENISKFGDDFPTLLKQLINDSITGKSQIDLVNETSNVASFIVRRIDVNNDLLPWFGCRLEKADDSKVIEHLTSLVLSLRREKDNLLCERDEDKKNNEELKNELDNLRDTKQLDSNQNDFQNILNSIHFNADNDNTNQSNPGSNSNQSENEVIPAEFEPPMFDDSNITNDTSNKPSTLEASYLDNTNNNDELKNSFNARKIKSDKLIRGMVTYVLCALCPESSQTAIPDEIAVMDHIVNNHFNDQRTCTGCPSKPDIQDIPSHIKMHMCKVYACKFCGKQSTKKNLLQTHVRTHTGERPFECNQCKRRFTDPSTLRRHKSIHTGEMKAPCPICGKIISRRDNIKSHMKNNHPTEDIDGILSQTNNSMNTSSFSNNPMSAIERQLNNSYTPYNGAENNLISMDNIKSDFTY